jgi:ankyrin repeat protein
MSGGMSGGKSGSVPDSSYWTPVFYASLNMGKLYEEVQEDRVKQLIEKDGPTLLSTLLAAVYWRRPESVDLLLSAGVNPNRRHVNAEDLNDHGDTDWIVDDPDQLFDGDGSECFPLHVAAWTPSDEGQQEKAYRIVKSLLRHGADPYRTYSSQLKFVPETNNSYARPWLPGQDIGRKPPSDDCIVRTRQRIFNEMSKGIGEHIMLLSQEFCCRIVIHAILEDDCFLKPFFDCPEFVRDLKLEHRCYLGRTLFLSACRNGVGADALLDKVLHTDRYLDPTLKYESDPRPAFPPGIYSAPDTEGAQPRTVIQALLSLGADPLARDDFGKNALHHLLEAHTGDITQPPVIRQSLRYLIAQFPSLVNQPDRNGMTPIHTALRRLWKYTRTYNQWHYIELNPPEDCVYDLIEAGADVSARDERNNTVLHYLADSHLDALDHGQGRRDLFYTLLDKYGCTADINTANKSGQTPIHILLGHTYRKDEWNASTQPDYLGGYHLPITTEAVNTELLARFDEAGVDWMVRDELGRTLLHGVAQTIDWPRRTEWRCRYLLQKGVDPLVRDLEGKTARYLAPPCQNTRVLDLLYDYENAAVRDQPHDKLGNALDDILQN